MSLSCSLSRGLIGAISSGVIALAATVAVPSVASTSIANPAASHCLAIGGEYVIRESNGGKTGFCKLGDGTERDAWQLFREDHAKKVGIANLAATFCVEKGGSYDIKSGNCTLPNGRVIDGWDYFRAENPEK